MSIIYDKIASSAPKSIFVCLDDTKIREGKGMMQITLFLNFGKTVFCFSKFRKSNIGLLEFSEKETDRYGFQQKRIVKKIQKSYLCGVI